MNPKSQRMPKLIYHVDWRDGVQNLVETAFSSNAPLPGVGTVGIATNTLTDDGLKLSVTRPAVSAAGAASAGVVLAGVNFDRKRTYVLQATLAHAAGPTGANDLWAIILLLKSGNQNDQSSDIRIPLSLQFRKHDVNTSQDAARLNMPFLPGVMPPTSVWLMATDYATVTSSAPLDEFTLSLTVDFGKFSNNPLVPDKDGDAFARVLVGSNYDRRAKVSEYDDNGVRIGLQTAQYVAAGIQVVLARGDGQTASVVCTEFKIAEFR